MASLLYLQWNPNLLWWPTGLCPYSLNVHHSSQHARIPLAFCVFFKHENLLHDSYCLEMFAKISCRFGKADLWFTLTFKFHPQLCPQNCQPPRYQLLLYFLYGIFHYLTIFACVFFYLFIFCLFYFHKNGTLMYTRWTNNWWYKIRAVESSKFY